MSNKFKQLRKKALKEFNSDKGRLLVANDAIDLAEEWLQSKGWSYQYLSSGLSKTQTRAAKADCKAYVKAGLWRKRKEGRYGIVGSFILAVFFAVIVQLIARWIINNFFD